MATSKQQPPHVAVLQRQLRQAQQTQPVEMMRLMATFPPLRGLIATLNDIFEAGDPRQGRNLDTVGTGGGEDDGTQIYGDGKKVTLRGGAETARFRGLAEHAAREIARLQRQLDNQLRADPIAAVAASEKSPPLASRRCRRERCDMKDRRQHGMHTDGEFICSGCGKPLAAPKT